MIQHIFRRQKKDGTYEQAWCFHVMKGVNSFFTDHRESESQVDLDVDFRIERAQIIVGAFSIFAGIEGAYIGEKTLGQIDAHKRLTDCLQWCIDTKPDMIAICEMLLKPSIDRMMKLIARRSTGNFIRYQMIINACNEQLEYEKVLSI